MRVTVVVLAAITVLAGVAAFVFQAGREPGSPSQPAEPPKERFTTTSHAPNAVFINPNNLDTEFFFSPATPPFARARIEIKVNESGTLRLTPSTDHRLLHIQPVEVKQSPWQTFTFDLTDNKEVMEILKKGLKGTYATSSGQELEVFQSQLHIDRLIQAE